MPFSTPPMSTLARPPLVLRPRALSARTPEDSRPQTPLEPAVTALQVTSTSPAAGAEVGGVAGPPTVGAGASPGQAYAESRYVQETIAQLRAEVQAAQSAMEAARSTISAQDEAIRLLREDVARLGSAGGGGAAAAPAPAGADAGTSRRTFFWRPPAGAGPPRASELKEQEEDRRDGLTGVPRWTPQQIQPQMGAPGPVPAPGGGSALERQAGAMYYDRRMSGSFDARFHSASWGATPKSDRILPARIILVRHAQSQGNIDNKAYASVADSKIPITDLGQQQAAAAGVEVREELDRHYGGPDYKVFFYTSPYKRSFQTYKAMTAAFSEDQVGGWQEEVQLREQDFGNFQDPEGKQREKAERLRFGRFFYRFPNGESGADVYDRITSFQNTMVRDINAGRFASDCSLVLVTHGLALRVFLMSWFHWTVDQFLRAYNPNNAEPVVLDRNYHGWDLTPQGTSWIHTKALYTLNKQSQERVKGVTDDMCYCNYLHMGKPGDLSGKAPGELPF